MKNGKNKSNSSGKLLKVLIPIILIFVVCIVGIFVFGKVSSSPKAVFKTAIQKVFKEIEMKQDSKTAEISAQVTVNVNSNDENIKSIQKYLNATKLSMTDKVDLNKEIMGYNLTAEYNNEKVVDANVYLQDSKIYLYAPEFFAKFVEIDPDAMGIYEFSEALEGMFRVGKNISAKETNKLMKEIEKEILNFLDKKEYTKEDAELTLDGKTIKTTQSTLKLNEKEMAEVLTKILKVLKNSEYFLNLVKIDDVDVKMEIEKYIEDLEDVETNGNFSMVVSLYTRGTSLVKAEAKINSYGEESVISYVKESKEKAVALMEANGEKIGLTITKKNSKTTEYTLNVPEELQGMEISIEHTEEGKNKGKIALNIKLPRAVALGMGLTDSVQLKLNVDYLLKYNITVDKANVENAKSINSFTNSDLQTIMQNFQKSKLFEVISTFEQVV